MSRVFIFLLVFLASCRDKPVPKPLGQLRLEVKDAESVPFKGVCPFESVLPSDSKFLLKHQDERSCWMDIAYPQHRAVIHLTYLKVDGNLRQLLEDAHSLTYEHHIKADRIETVNHLRPEAEVYGTTYHVYGPVATNTQFYLTDSVEHFLRGALYFQSAPNEDSLAPVTARIRNDIGQLISQLQWDD